MRRWASWKADKSEYVWDADESLYLTMLFKGLSKRVTAHLRDGKMSAKYKFPFRERQQLLLKKGIFGIAINDILTVKWKSETVSISLDRSLSTATHSRHQFGILFIITLIHSYEPSSSLSAVMKYSTYPLFLRYALFRSRFAYDCATPSEYGE